jgi:hypothetical protein
MDVFNMEVTFGFKNIPGNFVLAEQLLVLQERPYLLDLVI